jgi:hypothetical protein
MSGSQIAMQHSEVDDEILVEEGETEGHHWDVAAAIVGAMR